MVQLRKTLSTNFKTTIKVSALHHVHSTGPMFHCLFIFFIFLSLSRFLGFTSRQGRERIPGECLLISSLPSKALRTLGDIVRLAEPGKLDIKRRKPGILCISLQIYSLLIIDFCVDSESLATSIKKCNSIMT